MQRTFDMFNNSSIANCKKRHYASYDNRCDHKCRNRYPTYPIDRYFGDKAFKLRCKLGKLQYKPCPTLPQNNLEELKYKNYNYNGSFHKSFAHNTTDGRLLYPINYTAMKNALLSNDQVSLAAVPLAPGSIFKLTNPLSSLATTLVGASACTLKIDTPPSLSSASGAADMLEVYAMAVARDTPFHNYANDSTIQSLLGVTRMNDPFVLANLKYYSPLNVPFIDKTIFKGISTDEQVGPYISQLFFLAVPIGAGIFKQLYTTLKPRPGLFIEWGTTLAETITIQNGIPGSGVPNVCPNKQYIHDGRSLAEAVHNDPPYSIFLNAALILGGLGILPNKGLPAYPNQSGFNTGFGGPSIQCAIAEVTGSALNVAWYWKWQVYRKLRPEVFALWVHNVQASLVNNTNNFDIDNGLFSNPILSDIFGLYRSHTLPLCYPEGSPCHPAYPAGHAVISGACCTILKMYYDAEKPWNSLPGVLNGKLSDGLIGPVEADPAAGSAYTGLRVYTGGDAASMSIGGEINKLSSNVSIGRVWAGVHYRSDGVQGMALGEKVAIKYMEDRLASCVDNNLNGTVPRITFRKFDGTFATIGPTSCR